MLRLHLERGDQIAGGNAGAAVAGHQPVGAGHPRGAQLGRPGRRFQLLHRRVRDGGQRGLEIGQLIGLAAGHRRLEHDDGRAHVRLAGAEDLQGAGGRHRRHQDQDVPAAAKRAEQLTRRHRIPSVAFDLSRTPVGPPSVPAGARGHS
ncbi:hypothetical protein GCM10017778_22580 [Streptomyces vinaceus]|nr:hypothetical protein GCM10017778_22580 [Streptomyces vinaceus]